MAERMPTQEDMDAYVRMIAGSPTAKTPAARLNFAQDWWRSVGLDPFGTPFVAEPFPEEEFAPVTRQIYATASNSPYRTIFDAIDAGQDPISAARDAINDPSQPFGDPLSVRDEGLDRDITAVARQYADEVKTFEKERTDWQREQARKQAEAPVTLGEILNPRSQYEVISEAAGKPEGLTVDDMLQAYNRVRFEQGAAGRQRGMERRAAAPSAVQPSQAAKKDGGFWRGISDFAGNIVAPWRQQTIEGQRQRAARPGSSGAGKRVASVPPQRKVSEYQIGPAGSIADLLYRDAARRGIASQQQTPVWSPKARQTMGNIALMNLLVGGQ